MIIISLFICHWHADNMYLLPNTHWHLSQKTGCQSLSSYQLHSPLIIHLLKRSHSIIKGCLMAKMQTIMKTHGRWEACLVNGKLDSPASCFSHYCFSSALGEEKFPSASKWAAPCPFPPSFSDAHDPLVAVPAAWEPCAAVGITYASSTGWQRLCSSSW